MFSRRTFNKVKHQLLFIGLSVLLLVGIALLPKSPPTLEVPEAPMALVLTVAPTPALEQTSNPLILK